MEYAVEKRKVSRTGIASLGWHLGHGFVQRKLSVKADVWCVIGVNGIIAECRSKAKAEMVASALHNLDQ